MERIASFTVDHSVLKCGMYVSRRDGDVTTYDIRCTRPNVEAVMDNAAIHTVEHLFATFVRNSDKAEGVIYFGPMGCRTGFYFLVRDSVVSDAQALALTKAAFDFIIGFEGDVPGVSANECGNYREHCLEGAKKIAQKMQAVLSEWNESKLAY